ncbi:MAG: hypothetical protein IJL74_04630 [Bacilli bacterium]|nr:hypothetical protein [Bacilli bacterium]
MKIIFLDIDGVMLPIGSKDKLIPEDKILLLKGLIEETDSKVVLSSTWRLNANRKFYEDEDYENLVKSLKKHEIEIYDHTPAKQIKTIKRQLVTKSGMTIVNYVTDPNSTRGAEISDWLKENETSSFVILDDQDFYFDLFGLKDNFVKINNPYMGLEQIDVEQAKNILNVKIKVREK